MKKLSILICHLNEPFYNRGLKRLNEILDPQIEKYNLHVEKIINDKGRSMTTGEKRNKLIEESQGEFIVFIDSDDYVSGNYVERILWALDKDPDVVTFEGHMTTNNAQPKKFIIRLGSDYVDRGGIYYRWPNHLCPMRKSLIEKVKFPNVTKFKDFEWSKVIHKRRLLKTESHLSEDLYVYDFWDYNKRK